MTAPKTPHKRKDAFHLHARASQRAEGGLCAGTGGLRLVSSGGAHLDVEGGDAQLLRSRYAAQATHSSGGDQG